MYVPELEYYHVHTMLSNIFTQNDSTMSVDDYAKVFAKRGCRTLCLTEHGNRSDMYAQSIAAEKYSTESNKIKPIIGAECYFVPDRSVNDDRNFHLVVVGKDDDAKRQLNLMLSIANETGYYKHARIDFDLLSRLNPNKFIVTTACIGGIFKDKDGEKYCRDLHQMFGSNFYLEVQPHLKPEQVELNKTILEMYNKYNIPLILGTDSHYINHEDYIFREEAILSSGMKVQDGGWDLFLPTAKEAYDLMIEQNVLSRARIEEALENTLILREFDGITFDRTRKFPIAIDKQNMTQEQRNHLYQKMVCNGYIDKFGQPNQHEKEELRKEMNVVLETGSADYFIGLHDMIEKGIEYGGILTKTSRGSACGFATNAALGLTTINRLHSPVPMYPERFVTADKLKAGMPDIDSNITNVEAFERAGKDVFGQHSCYPMIAYGKTKTLSAFKMLARARSLDFDVSNEVSKQISVYENDRKHAIDNNQDDPDYDVDDDINIADYVDEKYIPLIEDSKQYQKIIVSVSPHPCAHLVYHKDLREEIGVISLKPKTGSTERQLCLYIDGTSADDFGYCKSDLLTVTVVKLIYNTFRRVGIEPLSANELLAATENDTEIWNLYAKGFTQGLNQCERPKTAERCMLFKPKNIVELCAFVAAIRPGAKSLVDDYVMRRPHSYGIKSMDDLLRLNGASGVTGESSYLFYDENVLQLGQAAGIDPGDAYALIKAIKKKKAEKVASYKDKFIPGFIKYLKEKENADDELAEKTALSVWQTIIDSASYLFNASHSFAVSLDSLFGAYLKVHYPYEFYLEMLKHCTEKGDTDKIAAIVLEMKKYKGIKMTPAKFGQDNRDWFVDKEHKSISQGLSAVKFISNQNAEDLFNASKNEFSTFTDLLRYLQMNTTLNKRQIDVLIQIGYFEMFGGRKKLAAVFNEFFDGKNKLTKTVKSFVARLEAVNAYEASLDDEDWAVDEIVCAEFENTKMCFTFDATTDVNKYFIQEVDDKYSVKLKLYSLARGTSGFVKIKKTDYANKKASVGGVITILKGQNKPRYSYKDGSRTKTGEFDYWVEKYTTEIKKKEDDKNEKAA